MSALFLVRLQTVVSAFPLLFQNTYSPRPVFQDDWRLGWRRWAISAIAESTYSNSARRTRTGVPPTITAFSKTPPHTAPKRLTPRDWDALPSSLRLAEKTIPEKNTGAATHAPLIRIFAAKLALLKTEYG